jgi:glycine/D-amino acid oxidase-like deaminating enzyme
MRKVAVVGAGFAGLSVAWHGLQKNWEIAVFDPAGIGGGASGIATGLLYPFPGRLCLRPWLASEGMAAASELLHIAEMALQKPVALRSGIYRAAILPVQKRAFRERAAEDPEAIWMEDLQTCVPSATKMAGLWIPSGITVFSKLYLEGLWKACSERGAILHQRKINALEELQAFDATVLCTGAEVFQFPECAHLPLSPVKGQTLLCRWKNPFASSLVGLGHITPTEHQELCHVGSTYEHQMIDLRTTPEAAHELLTKVRAFCPSSAEFEVVQQAVGIRMALKKGYRPIVEQVAPRAWVFTGLGSRGLLYHAVLGKRLVDKLLSQISY